MLKKYDTIILSPHLDDAALSCGGLCIQQTENHQRVLIVTFMAGDPPQSPFSSFAQQIHTRWELANQIVTQRRHEDRAACRLMGADFFHGDIPDAIYRHAGDLAYFYTSNQQLFGQVHQVDAANTITKLMRLMARLPPADQLIAPLTVGNHVDHQLVRQAAENYFGEVLLYYEDFPYVQTADALLTVIGNDRLNWKDETVRLNEDTLSKKAEAIAAFASQISTFFSNRADIDIQIKAYAEKVGGERYWRKL